MQNRKMIATDLDMTLVPLYQEKDDEKIMAEYNKALNIFKEILKKEDILLALSTGRTLEPALKKLEIFNGPKLNYAITMVGTKILKNNSKGFEELKEWHDYILENTKEWNIEKFKELAKNYKELILQGEIDLSEFKLSYYIYELDRSKEICAKLEKDLQKVCKDAHIVYSENSYKKEGYVDILPKVANKLGALRFLQKHLNLKKENIVFCGDSGNDLQPLSSDFNSILVKNATERFKKEVIAESEKNGTRDTLYITKGDEKLNGTYVAGIIEGLKHFNIIK